MRPLFGSPERECGAFEREKSFARGPLPASWDLQSATIIPQSHSPKSLSLLPPLRNGIGGDCEVLYFDDIQNFGLDRVARILIVPLLDYRHTRWSNRVSSIIS